MTVLRRKGELGTVVSSFLGKPLPADCGRLKSILLSAAAQLLVLETPPHAAISLAVDQTRADRGARRFDKLTNAVLRKVSTQGPAVLAGLDAARINMPQWLFARWQGAYGEETARAIAAASLSEAALDISVKADADTWAERLGGVVLPTGSVRLHAHGRIEDLPGFSDGAWWVQDAAAALPAQLLGNVAGLDVVDLCAAPGGKTAQLAARGAKVTAVDLSPERLKRVNENLKRLDLKADVVAADAAAWEPGRQFDAVLLDAPCTATGTIRRHPDIVHLKRDTDMAELAAVQARLLENASRLVKPGGVIVYCTCSLEPEEGAEQVARFLAQHKDFARETIAPGECGIEASWLTEQGDLRTLPFHLVRAEPGLSGLDGFFAARLRRQTAP
jgi:16S rRNA (cytosine967-C5)-methyltransferase